MIVFVLGMILLGIGTMAVTAVGKPLVEWIAGNGNGIEGGCPMMEGYPCTNEQKVMASMWAIILTPIGSILIILGVWQFRKEQRSKVVNK